MSVAENTDNLHPAPMAERSISLQFRGKASEYFGIWFVNVFLSIVTLGIYSAWAKVRRLRYFYGNTWLDGHNFEYWARPGQILIGRILVFGGFFIFNVLVKISFYFFALLAPFLFALPWFINKSLAFNARMTSYRNLRLNFAGSYWRCFWVYVCLPTLAVLTLGLLAPFATRARSMYLAQNLSYGGFPFKCRPGVGSYYWLQLTTLALGLCMVAPVAIVWFAVVAPNGARSMATAYWLTSSAGAIFYLILAICFTFYRVGARNIFIEALQLGDAYRFSSSISRVESIWIVISNLVVVACTFGLMRPWAAVRSWRYTNENIAVVTATSLDDMFGANRGGGDALAAEFTDFQGMDLGF